MTWAEEALYRDWRQAFLVKQELAQEHSAFQDIRVFESWSHGRVMMLDGVVQITEADEFAYQEMITHVPLIQHGLAKRVLIIGAGDGGVLRRVLEHKQVTEAVMVEIDAAVIRLARQYLPNIGGTAWDDVRARVVVGDGIVYVAEAPAQSFDVIIVDSTDPIGPGEPLFTEDFYLACARVLAPTGLLVNQCGVPFLQGEELQKSTRYRQSAFAHVGAYVVAAPSYIGGFMALGIASKIPLQLLTEQEVQVRADAAGLSGNTKYWSAPMHKAAFSMPPFILDYLTG